MIGSVKVCCVRSNGVKFNVFFPQITDIYVIDLHYR